MSVIIKVNGKTKPGAIQKALRKVLQKEKKIEKRTIADFYGALPDTFEDGLTYQKKLRNEWQVISGRYKCLYILASEENSISASAQ